MTTKPRCSSITFLDSFVTIARRPWAGGQYYQYTILWIQDHVVRRCESRRVYRTHAEAQIEACIQVTNRVLEETLL